MARAALKNSPRGLEGANVSVRVPSCIRKQLVEEADSAKISENNLINSYLFTALFLKRLVPQVGPPENILRLLAIIERGLRHPRGVALGTLHSEDWKSVQPRIKWLAESGFIEDLQDRSEVETVAFTFSVTEMGKSRLPLLIELLKPIIDSEALHESSRPRSR